MLHSATQYTYIIKALFTLRISFVVTAHLYEDCLQIVTELTKAQQQQHTYQTSRKMRSKCANCVQIRWRPCEAAAALISTILGDARKHHTAIWCADLDIGHIFVRWTTLRKNLYTEFSENLPTISSQILGHRQTDVLYAYGIIFSYFVKNA